jgi:hypothetical protein
VQTPAARREPASSIRRSGRLFYRFFSFGFLYHLVPGCIANLNPAGFAGDFFFGVETLATVGYGRCTLKPSMVTRALPIY